MKLILKNVLMHMFQKKKKKKIKNEMRMKKKIQEMWTRTKNIDIKM